MAGAVETLFKGDGKAMKGPSFVGGKGVKGRGVLGGVGEEVADAIGGGGGRQSSRLINKIT